MPLTAHWSCVIPPLDEKRVFVFLTSQAFIAGLALHAARPVLRRQIYRSARGIMDWSFVEVFKAPVSTSVAKTRQVSKMPDWDSADVISVALQKAAAQIQGRLDKILARWDIKLRQLGRDPQRYEWQHFRPLRRRREEDWSDWLAHLLATSKSGQLGYKLFREIVDSKMQGDFSHPEVEREVVVRNRRADIVLVTGNRVGIHVEVKIGDTHFEKTGETSALVADTFVPKRGPVMVWHNVLLVPEDLKEGEVLDEHHTGVKIKLMVWAHVARSIRAVLAGADSDAEEISWRVWAWTFIGCIEQKILGFNATMRWPAQSPSLALRLLYHLEQGEENDR